MENFEFKIFNSTLRFKGPMKYQVKINEKPTIFRTITMKASEFKELKYVLTWNSLQSVMLHFVFKASCGTVSRVWFYMKAAKPFIVYVNFYINTSESGRIHVKLLKWLSL